MLEKFDAFSRASISKELVISKKNFAGIALACALIPALTLGGSAAFAVADPELPDESSAVAVDDAVSSSTTGVTEPSTSNSEILLDLPEPGLPDGAASGNGVQPSENAAESLPAQESVMGTRSARIQVTFPSGVPASLKNRVQYSFVPAYGDLESCGYSAEAIDLDSNSSFLLEGFGPCEFTLSMSYLDDDSGAFWEATGMTLAERAAVDLRYSNLDSLAVRALVHGQTASYFPMNDETLASLSGARYFAKSATGVETELSIPYVIYSGTPMQRVFTAYMQTGRYTLRIQVPGAQMKSSSMYYSAGSEFGLTVDPAKATQFSVTNFARTQLKNMDPAGLQKSIAGGNKPKPTAPTFTDVKQGDPFYSDIRWLADSGITTGVKQSNGTYKFLPKNSVTREAMIAFLYRANGVKNYTPKGASPFVDVKKGDQFYTQIMWAYENKVTTGINLGNGKRKFDPKATITREAMAAFMYRQYATSIPVGSAPQNFTDIPANHKFAKEIKWMVSNKITTGVKQPNGTVKFVPKGATSREATAAFLHRAELKK